jgi:arylsulfatase A-like enzyme
MNNDVVMPPVKVVMTSLVDGVLTGMCLGVVHAFILSTGGLYALATPLDTLASFARYAGLFGLTGALVGAGVGLFLTVKTPLRKLTFHRFVRPAVVAALLLYTAPWLAFIVKEHFGRQNVRTTGLVGAGLFLLASLLTWILQRRYIPSPRAARSHRPATVTVIALLAVCLLLYGVPIVLHTIQGPGDVSSAATNPLEPLRLDAAAKFVDKAAAFPAKHWNLLLITIDTLRADHLGCYGYQRDTSPAIDALAESGMRFTRSFCQRPKTSPSFATIHTGTYPARHGVHGAMQVLAPDNETLAEVLSEAGWTTAAVITNGNLYPAFGFDQGFETYLVGHANAEEVSNAALAWLERRGPSSEPWFLWIHYTDPHTSYAPPPPYNTMFGGGTSLARSGHQRQVDLYDGEIRYVDDQIKRVLEWMDVSKSHDRSLVVFTADHGESLGEHDYYYMHGLHPYEPSAHVPLTISAAGLIPSGTASGALIGGVDIAPTLLDALGIDVPGHVQGLSFLPTAVGLSNNGPQDFVLIEAGYGFHDYAGKTRALRRESTKYVQRLTSWAKWPRGLVAALWTMNARLEGGLAPDELYDLATDPKENVNLLMQRRSRSEAERRILDAFATRLFDEGTVEASPGPAKLDPSTKKSLRSLGYL